MGIGTTTHMPSPRHSESLTVKKKALGRLRNLYLLNPFKITFIMTVDSIPPVIHNIPDDITVTIPLGLSGIQVSWEEPTATDNSGVVESSLRSMPPGSFFTVGRTPVTYTFTDPLDNSASATFYVDVRTGNYATE